MAARAENDLQSAADPRSCTRHYPSTLFVCATSLSRCFASSYLLSAMHVHSTRQLKLSRASAERPGFTSTFSLRVCASMLPRCLRQSLIIVLSELLCSSFYCSRQTLRRQIVGLITSLLTGLQNIAISPCLYICLYVCLCVRSCVSITIRPNFTEFSLHVARGRANGLQWTMQYVMYFRFCG